MKALKVILTGMAAAALMANAAYGQQVAGEKRAPLSLVPDLYSKVEVQHITDFQMTDDDYDGATPKLRVRPYLGYKMMDGKLDTWLRFTALKRKDTTQVEQGRPRWYTEFAALSGTYGSILPYADVLLPFNGSGTNGALGVTNTAELPIATTIGAIKLSATADGQVVLASRTESTTYRREARNEFGLVETKEETGTQKQPTYNTQYILAAAITPAAVSKLTVELSSWLNQNYTPVYDVRTDGSEKVSYPVETETQTRLRLSWKASKNLSIIDDLYQSFDGVYEGRRDQTDVGTLKNTDMPRLQNYAGLSYTLF